ncbi:MAG: hypothetical protein ACI4HJ_04855 [Ruminococcus sp.]
MASKLQGGIGKLNKRLMLYKITAIPGNPTGKETDHRCIWADVFSAGISTQYSAEAVGKKVESNAVVRKNAYHGETHAIYENQKFKIDKVAPADSEDKLKLILVRE